MSGPRLLFYVQHLLGIGHLARASRIAGALVEDGFDVTMVTGGTPVRGFPDKAIRTVALPAATSAEGFSGLVGEDGQPVNEAFKAGRLALLLSTLEAVRPDIVMIEAFPFGRRQMRFELLPFLDAIAGMTPKPLLVTSVRDILQERQKPGRNAETVDLLNRHFDLVLAHGDPKFATLAETFPEAATITTNIAYTGLVAARPPEQTPERFDVLVSAGGGAAGADLVKATVEAAKLFAAPLNWALITGPNLADTAYDAAVAGAPAGLAIFRFRPDFPSLLTGAELSVSQAGYNTVCDILRAGCRSLLVPFSAGGETEQSVRAERLARLGLAGIIDEDGIGGPALAEAIKTALARPRPPAAALDLNGARRTAEILRERLRRRATPASARKSESVFVKHDAINSKC